KPSAKAGARSDLTKTDADPRAAPATNDRRVSGVGILCSSSTPILTVTRHEHARTSKGDQRLDLLFETARGAGRPCDNQPPHVWKLRIWNLELGIHFTNSQFQILNS